MQNFRIETNDFVVNIRQPFLLGFVELPSIFTSAKHVTLQAGMFGLKHYTNCLVKYLKPHPVVLSIIFTLQNSLYKH